eukprot:12388754-Alexandrium_andersonii.AAC.1
MRRLRPRVGEHHRHLQLQRRTQGGQRQSPGADRRRCNAFTGDSGDAATAEALRPRDFYRATKNT